MVGGGFVGSGGVISGADTRMLFVPWAFVTSLDMASDTGSFGNPNLDKSRFVLNVVGVYRLYRTSSDGRSRNSERSGTLSREMELVRRNRFHAVKRARISAKIVSILAE